MQIGVKPSWLFGAAVDGTEGISTKTKVIIIINIQFIQLFIRVIQGHELFSQQCAWFGVKNREIRGFLIAKNGKWDFKYEKNLSICIFEGLNMKTRKILQSPP